jgi:adenine-specific DNA glycosylase
VRGRAVNERSNHRRIWIGRGYHSRATSLELAAVVNAHTKERLRAFTSAQRDEVV